MAIKLKPKPKQITRSQVKSIDDKAYGSEPIVIAGLGNALNWYNYMASDDQSREWFFTYLKKNYSKNDVALIRKLPKWKVTKTLGNVARILLNGNELPQSNMDYFNDGVQELIKAGMKIVDEVEDAPKPVIDIQSRIRSRADTLITMVEEQIDVVMNDGFMLDMYTFLQKHEVTPQVAGYIRDYYLPMRDEVLLDDEQVKESYGKKLAFWRDFYCTFITDCDRFINNKKAVKIRKPREKKVKSAVDLVKNLKYQKEEPSLKIVSVHPTEIVGCSQLWVYNTKYKKITQYLAVGPAGIQVKGTTLTGWDIESSMSKTVRKPEKLLTELLSAGKVGMRSFMSSIKTAQSNPNGRINEQTIILRVVK